jgi:hypothetical protein
LQIEIHLSRASASSNKIDALRTLFLEYKKGCKEILPKVNPTLILDLVEREQQEHHEPIYMLEMFTKSGLDSEQIRNVILEKIGVSPEIYDNGTHYVTNQKISLEMLKEISDHDDVVALEGDYTGEITGLGPSHNWDQVRARMGIRDSYNYQY